MNKEVTLPGRLPQNGQMVLCFGHKTMCCDEDMDLEPDWHLAKFEFSISYRVKNPLPENLCESLIEYAEVHDYWKIDEYFHVIGVTKWKIAVMDEKL